jgi:hypothetical protein
MMVSAAVYYVTLQISMFSVCSSSRVLQHAIRLSCKCFSVHGKRWSQWVLQSVMHYAICCLYVVLVQSFKLWVFVQNKLDALN